MSEAAEVHRKLLAGYPDLRAGRLEEGLKLIDPDVVDHRGGAEGDHHGIAAWRARWERMADGAFRDMAATVEQNVASGDISVNRYTFTGPGFQVTGLDMIRVRNGRVVEHWALLDTDAIRHQTG
jgi:predicted ester cyclase